MSETLAYGNTTHVESYSLIADPVWTRKSAIRAFVIYAAEWWQRHYNGGPWAWEPLLESLGWHRVHYPDLYVPVREALSWWKVGLVRLPTSVRYLGTFACQGGLPLALVGDAHSRVTHYLRAVLRHTATYRKSVDDPIELARDQQHLLRPPTLRRDYVFRLAADITESVLNLQDELNLQDDAMGEDLLDALDQARQNWRDTMPLDFSDERARQLLTGLLREAARDRTASVDDFRVDRFLRHTGVGWRLGARVRLPASIAAQNLATRLKISVKDLRPRLQVRMSGDRMHEFGLYAEKSDGNYILISRHVNSVIEIWDADAAGEIRLSFRAGDVVGETLVPTRGGALGELPWAFRGDEHEAPLIGEGSVTSRAPEIFVLPPQGDPSTETSSEEDSDFPTSTNREIVVRGRILRRITEPTPFETDVGRCVVKPSARHGVEEDYHLSGQRIYNVDSNWPLFRGVPQLRIVTPERSRVVSAKEVNWRQTGGDWQACPTSSGLWELRHTHGGELRYHARAGILPKGFSLWLVPGDDMTQGQVELSGTDGVRVAGRAEENEYAVQPERLDGGTVRVRVTALNAATVPSRISLRLHWHSASELPVYVPFPGRGARFLRDDRPVDGPLAVDDLYGVRAIALASATDGRFWVEAALKAPDLDIHLLRVAYFRVPLQKSGMTHELSLIDMRSTIELLLVASSSSDAVVALRLVDQLQHEHSVLHVRRFAGVVECDASMKFVTTPETVGFRAPLMSYEALPITRPHADLVPLDVVGPSDAPNGAVFPEDTNINEPWLVMAHGPDHARVRPLMVHTPNSSIGTDFVSEMGGLSLREAVSVYEPNLRLQSIASAMRTMLSAKGTRPVEDDWSFLTDSLVCATALPATESDVLKVLITIPDLLVRCMFRLESTPRQLLWRLEDELPFSWLMIRRDIWETQAFQEIDRLRDDLVGRTDAIQIAQDYIRSILKEGADRFPGLYTVVCDIGFRMEGRRLPRFLVDQAIQKRDCKTQEQLTLRYSMNDWPKGDGRFEWVRNLKSGQGLHDLAIWQEEGEAPRERQPIFDTPVAAAWCCFASKSRISKPTNRTIFLIKRIRAHDPEWFDLVYEAAWFQLANMQDIQMG